MDDLTTAAFPLTPRLIIFDTLDTRAFPFRLLQQEQQSSQRVVKKRRLRLHHRSDYTQKPHFAFPVCVLLLLSPLTNPSNIGGEESERRVHYFIDIGIGRTSWTRHSDQSSCTQMQRERVCLG